MSPINTDHILTRLYSFSLCYLFRSYVGLKSPANAARQHKFDPRSNNGVKGSRLSRVVSEIDGQRDRKMSGGREGGVGAENGSNLVGIRAQSSKLGSQIQLLT